MVYPRLDCVFILDVDASEFAIGGELSQIIDGKERVITYASHKLSKAQRRYCTTRLELLSLVKHIQQFRNYLLGKRFIVNFHRGELRLQHIWADGCDGSLQSQAEIGAHALFLVQANFPLSLSDCPSQRPLLNLLDGQGTQSLSGINSTFWVSASDYAA